MNETSIGKFGVDTAENKPTVEPMARAGESEPNQPMVFSSLVR